MTDLKVPEAIYVCPGCGKVFSTDLRNCGAVNLHRDGKRQKPVRAPIRPAADGDRLADALRNFCELADVADLYATADREQLGMASVTVALEQAARVAGDKTALDGIWRRLRECRREAEAALTAYQENVPPGRNPRGVKAHNVLARLRAEREGHDNE